MKQFNLLLIFLILISYSHLKADKLFTWGNNDHGQLGDGTTTENHIPTQVGTDTTWIQVSGGMYHMLGIKTNGTLWAWGFNDHGQLGDGTTNESHSLIQIGSENDWLKVTCGRYYTTAMKNDGTLWAWGENIYGQLGDGTTNESHSPIQIGTDKNWVQVDCGLYHTVAIKTDGTLWAWGSNSNGQLGIGTTVDSYSPVQIGINTNWSKVTCCEMCNIALKCDGTLWAWGANLFGVLGDGTITDRHTPIQIGTGTNWSNLAYTEPVCNHIEAIKTDNTLWAWGYNWNAQIGDGTTTDRHSPIQIGTETNWVEIACSVYHTLALKKDGTLWAWGSNPFGEFGNGTTSLSRQKSPIQIGSGTHWTKIFVGSYCSVALKSSDCDELTSSPSSINFGDRTCLLDTSIIIKINNLMSNPVGVSQTIFALNTNSKLSVSNGGTFTIAGNDSRQISISINPTATGLLNDTLFVVYPDGCDTLLMIPITGIRDTIDFSLTPSDTLYFGKTCPNVPVDTLIKVKNKSSKATSLMKNSNISPFSIIGTDPFASIFAFNETKDLHLRFISPDTGIFYQNLIITDTCGKTKKIVLKAEIHVPQADAGADQTICLKDTLLIGNTAIGGTPPFSYKWYPATGLTNTNTAITKASPKATTVYYLTTTDSIGCSSTDSIKIIVNPLPIPFITGAILVCENQNYVYTITTPPCTSNSWEISGAISVDSSRKDTLIIVWGKNRIGKLKLVQTIPATDCKDSVVEDITINTVPKPDITGNTGVCSNSIQKYFTSKKGFINKWYIIGGNCLGTPIGDTINVIWTDTSLAKIKLVQSNSSGCADSIEMNIKVNPSPIVKLEKNITILC